MSESRVAKVAFQYCRFDGVVDRKAKGVVVPYEVFFRLSGPPVKFCRIVVQTDSPEVAIDYVIKRFPGAQLLERAFDADARLAAGPKRFISRPQGRDLAPCLERKG